MIAWTVAAALYFTGALITGRFVEEVNSGAASNAVVVLLIVFWPFWVMAGALVGVVQWVWEHRRRH